MAADGFAQKTQRRWPGPGGSSRPHRTGLADATAAEPCKRDPPAAVAVSSLGLGRLTGGQRYTAQKREASRRARYILAVRPICHRSSPPGVRSADTRRNLTGEFTAPCAFLQPA